MGNHLTFVRSLFLIQPRPTGTHEAMQPCGIAVHKPVGGNVARDYAAGAHHCPLTDGYSTTDGRISPDRGAIPNPRLCHGPVIPSLQGAIWINGSREQIVGKTDMGADENPVLYRYAVIYRYIILNFDIISYDNTGVNIYPFADNAIGPNTGTLTDLSVVPDRGAVTNLRIG